MDSYPTTKMGPKRCQETAESCFLSLASCTDVPNPNTIIVVSESKYFGRYIKLSIFYISLFPQSKLKLYSHNCNFLFQMCQQNLLLIFYTILLQYLTFVSLFLVTATLYLPNCNFTVLTLHLNILKMPIFLNKIVTWYHNIVSNIIFCSNNGNFAFQNISLFLPIVTLYHMMLQLYNCDIIFCKVTYLFCYLLNLLIMWPYLTICYILHFSLLQIYCNAILPMWCHLT